MRTYAKCTEISTALAAYVRELGYPAIAHHNGASEVQAIPISIRSALANWVGTAA